MNLRYIAVSLVNFFVGIVEVFLGLRFILRLFSANSNNAFVSWIYDMSAEVLQPFRGIFPTAEIANGIVIEFSTLFAMLIYALFGLLVIALINAVTPGTKKKVVRRK